MIIIEGEAERQIKNDIYDGLTIRHPLAAHARSSSPLPDYATSEAQHRVHSLEQVKPKLQKVDSKVWRGAFYALIIYVFLSLVIIIPILVLKTRSKKPQVDWPPGTSPASLWSVEDSNFSLPNQLSSVMTLSPENMTCNIWNHTFPTSNEAYARYSLPPNGLVTIRSNVTYTAFSPDQITGSLTVSRNEDSSVHEILLSLFIKVSAQSVLRRTNICFSPSGKSRGLSIYVPQTLARNDSIDMDIQVVLPQMNTQMDSFVTFLPMLSQNFSDLVSAPVPSFKQFSIEGAVRPISCKSLKAPQISVKNIASSVDGIFNVTSALFLDSIKGSIISDITLTRPYMAYRPTYLTIETGDSTIRTNVTLNSPFSSTKPSRSPDFVAKVTTFNGPLDLSIKHGTNQTSHSLQLQVQNNLAESSVSLDHGFQGTFSAKTKMSHVTIIDTANLPGYHPTGKKNDSRIIVYNQKVDDFVTGWAGPNSAYVNDKRASQSDVDISSALSPITLTFG